MTARTRWQLGGIHRKARGWSLVSDEVTDSTGADHCHSAARAAAANHKLAIATRAIITILFTPFLTKPQIANSKNNANSQSSMHAFCVKYLTICDTKNC